MNDPIHLLCSVPQGKVEDNFLKPFSFTSEEKKVLLQDILSKVQFKFVELKGDNSKFNPPAVYCNVDRYNLLQKVKMVYSHQDADKYEPLVYPYETANNSIFLNRCGLKLANIDKIFNLSTHNTGLVNQYVTFTDFVPTFCDIAGGPGGFTQYLQYRLPRSIGYGITSKKHIDWRMNRLDISRFIPIYGSDATGTGDMYKEWEFFIQTVKFAEPLGTHLVVADAGFDVTRNEDFNRQEFLSARLITIEILIGILCCRSKENKNQNFGSYFVCKFFDTVTNTSMFLLMLCALAFEEIHLFKPVTSRWTNAEKYLVCRNRISDGPDLNTITNILRKMINDQTEFKRIIEINIPNEQINNFTQWLTLRNNESTEFQIKIATQLINLISGKISEKDLPKVNLHYLLVALDIPGERIQEKK